MRKILLFIAAAVIVTVSALAVNVCVESGPHYSSWACAHQGTLSPGYAWGPTNIQVNLGQLIIPPTAAGLSITNGLEYRWVTYDCTPEQNHYETNAVAYTFGSLIFSPSLPQAIWTSGTYNYTVKVVATAAGNVCSPITYTLGTFTVVVGTNVDALLDVDFGPGTNSAKTGYAAIGDAASDYWNHYPAPNQSSGSLTNLHTADNAVSPIGMLVTNLAASATNNSSDAMYRGFLFTNASSIATVTLTNLPPGFWDVYVYSTNGNVEVLGGSNSYGVHANTDPSPVNPPAWREGLQYARFASVNVPSNQPLTIRLWSSNSSLPTISGLQIASQMHTPPVATNPVPPTVVVWGENMYGQTNVPPGLSNVVAIAGGWNHSIALKKDGTISIWGGWTDNGPSDSMSYPAVSNVAAVAGAAWNSLILHSNGTVQVLGTNNVTGQTNVPAGLSNVAAISANSYSFLALKTNGTVVGWGDNGCGESAVPAGISNVMAIAAGAAHSLALMSNGIVVGWGATCWANYGEATPPAGLSNVIAIAAGWGHSMALKSNGTVVAWGYNGNGECNVPAGLSNVVAISAGAYHSMALKSDGTVVIWGQNVYGQTTVPGGLQNVVAISAGGYHSMALVDNSKFLSVDSDYDGVSDAQELADRTNPNDPNSVLHLKLNHWSFDNTNSWIGDGGQLPLVATNVVGVPSWNSNAVRIDASSVAMLKYRDVEANGNANINLRNGTIRFWFKPDWSSTNAGGVGPQNEGRFIEMGTKGSGDGWWGLGIDATGTNLYFGTQTNSTLTLVTNGAALASFSSNNWYQIVLTYSPSNSTLYLNGRAAFTNGIGVTNWPALAVRAQGFGVGSDLAGNHEIKGAIEDLETFNYPISAQDVSNGIPQLTIVTQPSDQVVAEGGTTTFTVGVVSSSPAGYPLHYQWYFNSNAVAGATNSTLTLSDVDTDAQGFYHVTATNLYASVTSRDATLTISVPPEITQDPSSITNIAGTSATFSVQCTGTPPLHYQWYYYGSRIFGANQSNYTIASVTPLNAGSYSVMVTNVGGVAQSATATLTVLSPPKFTQQPTNLFVNLGDQASFMATVSGTTPITYQWRLNGQDIPSAVYNSYYVNPVTPEDLGTYTLVASNMAGVVVSTNAVLATNVPPMITSQPVSLVVTQGQTATFSVTATGTAPLSYRWVYEGMEFSAGVSNIYSVTNAQATIGWLEADHKIHATNDVDDWDSAHPVGTGDYSVVVANAGGSVTSSVVQLWVVAPPVISNQPPNQAVTLGSRLKLSVDADGTPPFVYQWRFAGTNIHNATNSSYVVNSVKATDAGLYSVVLTNLAGSTTSSNIQVVIPTAVFEWGDNTYGQTNVPPGLAAVAVAAGGRHSLALTTNGTVVAWGDNSAGQTNVPNGLANVVAIAAGDSHSLALKSNGRLVAWGDDSIGQTDIPANATNIAAIAAGDFHNLALTSNGMVIAWGSDVSGQVDVPSDLSNVVAMAAGASHSMALKDDGTVVAWGDDSYGQINVPGDLALTVVASIAAGGHSSMAIRDDGILIGWADASQPPGDLSSNAVVAATAGAAHRFVIRQDLSLESWGDDAFGQLDNPTNIAWPAAISAGGSNTLAIAGLAPWIVNQPADYAAPIGSNANFTVTATGNQPLAYQWYFNRVAISGATNSTFIVTNVQITNGGSYQVLITNRFGSIMSSNATLLPVVAPTITKQPISQGIRQYRDVLFTVDVAGTAPFVYQWMFNGIPIQGATQSVYAVTGANTSDAGNYSVVVTNLAGSATSSNALLKVYVPPSIVVPLENIAVGPGANATFSANFAGTAPLTYQWWFDGNLIPGATQSSYTLTNVQGINAGRYSVVANNAGGSVEDGAMLEVLSYDIASLCAGPFVSNPSAPGISMTSNPMGRINGTNYYAISYLTAVGETGLSPYVTNPPLSAAHMSAQIALTANVPNVIKQRIWRNLPGTTTLRLLAEVPAGSNSYLDQESDAEFNSRIGLASTTPPASNTSGGGTYVADPVAPPVSLTNNPAGEIDATNTYALTYVTAQGETSLGALMTNLPPSNGQSARINLQTNLPGVLKTRIWRNIPTSNDMRVLIELSPTQAVYFDKLSCDEFSNQLASASVVPPDSNTTYGDIADPASAPPYTMTNDAASHIDDQFTYAISYLGANGETALSPLFTNASPINAQAVRITLQTNLANVIETRIWRTLTGSTNLNLLAEVPTNQAVYLDEESSDQFAARLALYELDPPTNNTTAGDLYLSDPPSPVVSIVATNAGNLDLPTTSYGTYAYAISYVTALGQTALSPLVIAPAIQNQHQALSVVVSNTPGALKTRIWRTSAALNGSPSPQLYLLAELPSGLDTYIDNEPNADFADRVSQQAVFASSPPTGNTTAGVTSLQLVAPNAGADAVSFQWSSNGIPLPGATNQTYVLDAAWATDCWYTAVSRDAAGLENSKSTYVNVNKSTSVYSVPSDQVTCVGGRASLVIGATGRGLQFQWAKVGASLVDSTHIHGVTTTNLVIDNVQESDAGTYMVTMTDACGDAIHMTATLYVPGLGNRPSVVIVPPQLHYSPVQVVYVNGYTPIYVRMPYWNITDGFARVASPVPGVTYEWLLDGEVVGTGTEIDLTTVSFHVYSESGQAYYLPGTTLQVREDGCTNVVSNPYQLPPYIWNYWYQNYYWNAYNYWSLSPDYGLNWWHNLFLWGMPQALFPQAVNLTVGNQPQSQIGCQGQPVTFSAPTFNSYGLSWWYLWAVYINDAQYQWYKQISGYWFPINGATDPTYTIPSVSTNDAGAYRVNVAVDYQYLIPYYGWNYESATVWGDPITLTVPPAGLQITGQPQGGSVEEGSNFVFQVSGLPPGVTYLWTKDGAPLSDDRMTGTESNILTISPVTQADSGFYQVTASTPCETVVTIPASLTVCHIDWHSSQDVAITNLVALSNAVISASSQAYAASNAFDGFVSTNAQTWTNCWWPVTVPGSWLRVDLASPKVVESYDIFPASPSGLFQDTGVAEVSWVFQGSTDGTNWISLHVGTAASPWTNGVARTFFFDTTNTAYSHYQITNYGVWTNAARSTNIVGISELRLYERVSTLGDSCGKTTVINPPVNSAAPVVTVDYNPITITNTTVVTNWATATDSDSSSDEIVVSAVSTNDSVIPIVTQTDSNQANPGTNRYSIRIVTVWGYSGTNTVTLVASNTTPPYLSSSQNFVVRIPAVSGGTTNSPTNGTSRIRLGYWRFNDAPAWHDEGGLAPSATNGLVSVSSWSGDAVYSSAAQQSLLEYPWRRGPYPTNPPVIACDSGTLRFWFRPDWGGMTGGGNGPGKTVRLFEAGKQVPYTWILSLSDCINSNAFISDIINLTNGVASYIRQNLSSTTVLSDPAHTSLKDLLKDVNVLLMGPSIFDQDRFNGIILRPQTQALLASNPTGDDLLRLNRMLFEDAFGTNEFKFKPTQPDSPYPAWLAISVNSLGTMLKLETQSAFSRSQQIAGLATFPMHQWSQIVLVCDTNATTETFRLYFNGKLLGSAAVPLDTNWLASLQSQGVFRVGSSWGGDNQAEGAFDEMETFNFPMGDDEIYANYAEITTRDTDGDGLPDVFEDGIGTNPLAMDSDCDGLPDGWEYTHGYNPDDPYDFTPLALQTYEQELLRPQATNSNVPVLQIRPGKEAAYLTWDGVGGAVGYTIYRSTNFSGTFTQVGSTSDRWFADSTPPLTVGQTYYYRVECAAVLLGTSGQNSLAYKVQSDVVAVMPFGCPSNPPPRLSYINTLSAPSVNGSYDISFNMLLTNSALVNIGGQPLSYMVDTVTSGSLMINGAPYGPDNKTITNGTSAIWTPPTTISDPNTPAFRVYVSDGVQRFEKTVDVRIVVQPTRYVFAWGKNESGQLGNGHYEDTRTHIRSGGCQLSWSSTYNIYFPWFNISWPIGMLYDSIANAPRAAVTNLPAWEALNGIIPPDSHWLAYTNDELWAGCPLVVGVNPEYSQWDLTPLRVLNLPSNIHSISVGSDSRSSWSGEDGVQSLAVDDNGKLWQWGRDENGLLGKIYNLAETNWTISVPMGNISADVTEAQYKAIAWSNAIPDGWTNEGMPMPLLTLPTIYRVPDWTNGGGQSFDNVQSVCGASDLRIVLKRDGTVWSWGASQYLGRSLDTNQPTQPNIINIFDSAPWFDFEFFSDVWFDLFPGRVMIPGNDTNGVLPGRKVVEIQSGEHATIARCADGTMWWWGEMAYQLTAYPDSGWFWGYDGMFNYYNPGDVVPVMPRDESQPWAPVCISSLGSTNGVADPVIKMSVSQNHWVFLRADGTVVEFGHVPVLSAYLGAYDFNTNEPVSVPFPAGVEITSVAAAPDYGVAVDDTGNVWAWGWINGKLVSTPQPLPLKNVVKAVCSASTVLALDNRGVIWGWGDTGTYGALQVNPVNNYGSDYGFQSSFKARPLRMNGIENATDIFAGGGSVFAVGVSDEGKPTHLVGIGLDQEVRLTWNTYPGAAQYNIYRSSDPDVGYVLIGTASNPTYLDGATSQVDGQNALVLAPLTNGQTYYYRVSALVNGVETAKSIEVGVSPQPVPSIVPGLILTNKCRSVLVTWNASTNAAQSNPIEYRVDRAAGTSTNFEPIAHYAPDWNTNPTTMQYEDSEVVTNAQYSYRVIAVNDAGESIPSNVASVDTGDGNCLDAPQLGYCSAEIKTEWVNTDGSTSTDDGTDSLLLGDGGDGSDVTDGTSSDSGSSSGFSVTYAVAHLSWSYPVVESGDISAFRFRYQYLSQGHPTGNVNIQDVSTNQLSAPQESDGIYTYSYDLQITPQTPCVISVSAIRSGEETRSSDSVTLIAETSFWNIQPRAIPGYQQVYLDWPDSDLIYSYNVECTALPLDRDGNFYNMSADNSVMLLSDSLNCRAWDTGLNSSNFTAADILTVQGLACRLTNANDSVAQQIWNSFTPSARTIVTNYLGRAQLDSRTASARQTIVDQLNVMIHGGTNLFNLTQLGLMTNGDFCARTRADLIRQANAGPGSPFTAEDVAELNRFMIEDLFVGQIARMRELEPAEFVAADIKSDSLWNILNFLKNGNDPDAVILSNDMRSVVNLASYDQSSSTQTVCRALAIGLTAAIQNTNLCNQLQPNTNSFSARLMSLYSLRSTLSFNDTTIMNRLILEQINSTPGEDVGQLPSGLQPMTGLRYYVVDGNHYDGFTERCLNWVAAQPSDTAPPPPALTLTAQAFPYSSMVLVQWYVPGTTNYTPGSGTNWQFCVERKTGTDPYSPITAVGFGLSYLDQDVVNGTTYTYRITAMDQNFNLYQAEVTATPTYSSALTLLAPVPGNGYIDLTWTPVRAAIFYVEHSLDDASFEVVGTLGNNGNAYQNADSHFRHLGIQNGIRHYYRIRGVTPTGIEFYSNTNSGVPLATLPPLPPDSFNVSLTTSPDGIGARAVLTWTPQSGANTYQVFVRQGSALTPLLDGRALSCTYDIPLDTPDGATLAFDIRCVTADGAAGEMKEITAIFSQSVIDSSATNAPPIRLKVAGMFAGAFTNVIAPTNLTLGVETSLAINRVSFFDDAEDGRHLLGVIESEPFAMTWMQPKGGMHSVTANVEVKVGDDVTSGNAQIALMTSDAVGFSVTVKPDLAAYSTAATDLQLPAPGLSISLGRSYTSHNTGTNLLGVGWVPSWNGGMIKFPQGLTSGWIGGTGNFLTGITMYTVSSKTNHEADVTLPSGEQVPFWVGIEGQTMNDPASGDVGDLDADLVLGAYDNVGGTLTCNGGGSRVHVVAHASFFPWSGTNVTLMDGESDEDPAPISFSSFTYTASDGTSYFFNQPLDASTWLLTSVTDRNGNSLTYTYGDGSTGKPANQIVAITHSGGRGVTLSYTPTNNWTNIDVFDQITTTPVLKYVLSPNGQLTEVWRLSDRSNTNNWEKTKYVYGSSADDTNRIVEVYDPRGVRVVGNAYMSAAADETAGNLLRQTNIANCVTSYNLTNGQLTVIQTVNGVSKVINVAHDDSGAIIGVTQPVNGTNAPSALTVTNTYDDRGRLIAQRDALGGLKTFTYDGQDHLIGQSDGANSTSSEMNSFGEPTESTDANGNLTSTTYDSVGNPVSMEDPSGTVTTYEYADPMTTNDGRKLGQRLRRELRDAPGVPYTLVTIYSYIGESGDAVSSPAFGDTKSVTEEWGITDDANNVQVVGTPITVSYEYDANGNRTNEIKTRTLSSGVTESISSERIFDAQNRSIGSTIQSSVGGTLQATSMTFDQLGKPRTSTGVAGNTVTNTYDFVGNLIEVAYPDGTVSRTSYTLDGHAEFTQDRATNAATTVAPATRTTYDASGNAIKVERFDSVSLTTNAAASGSDYFGPATGLLKMTASTTGATLLTTTRTYYDILGRVLYTIDARTNVTAKVYDNTGRCTNSLLYLQTNQLVANISDSTTTASLGATLSSLTPAQSTSYVFDPNGNQIVVTDTLGRSITNVYDSGNRVVEVDFPDAGQGRRSHLTRYDGLGRRVQNIDENGVVTKYTYDFRGLLTSVTLGFGTAQSATTVYEYDELGNETKQTDAAGHTTTFSYDALGHRTSETLPGTQSNLAVYNLFGQVATNFDFIGQRAEFRYDQFGRLTNKFYFVVGQTHPSNSVAYVYNELGRVTNITERYGNDASAIYAAANFYQRFHTASVPVKVIATLAFTAPKWGGPLIALGAVAACLTLLPGGRRLRKTLIGYYMRGGWRLENACSGLPARLRRRLEAEAQSKRRMKLPSLFWREATLVALACYLVCDPSLEQFWIARADCSIPSNGSTLTTRITNFIYDDQGRVLQVNTPEGVINYSYDSATGQQTNSCTAYSSVGYAYDSLGRLKTVHVTKHNGVAADETTTYGYDAVGNRQSVSLPNNITTLYAYDSLNRLTNLTHQTATTLLANYSYGLNATGRRTSATEILREESGAASTYLTNGLTWQFDSVYRLTNEVSLCSTAGASYTNAFTYDAVGNRLKQVKTTAIVTTIASDYDANDQLLRETTSLNGTASETNNYAYDANGSMVGKTNCASSGTTTLTYAYNPLNKLSSVTGSGGTTSFQYNYQGIRVRSIGASTAYYLIDSNNRTGFQQVMEEFSTLGSAPTKSYVLGDDILAQTTGSAPSYFLYDGHGSMRQMSDTSGGVVCRYNYDAYGAVQTASSSSSADAAAVNTTSKLYCGEQYDSALQMYNLRARYYNPLNGRFNQRDTFRGNNEDPKSLHKYTYANCDPVNNVDPSGMFSLIEMLVVVAILFVLAMTYWGLLNHSVQGARAGLTRKKLEGDVDIEFSEKPLLEKMIDDSVVAAAKLERFGEKANQIAELRESFDKVDKVIGVAVFCKECAWAREDQKEKLFMVACHLEEESPDDMKQVLTENFGGVEWKDLSQDDVINVGQYIIDTNRDPEATKDLLDSLSSLIDEGAEVDASLP